ncbi:MAG: hypothetical protein EXR75_11985, partial [Myxococcales bacterium]|nr:hypothetical protein [Myxococcales bacterium]
MALGRHGQAAAPAAFGAAEAQAAREAVQALGADSDDLAAGGEELGARGEGRVRWSDLCRSASFIGRWIALDAVRYDGGLP